MYMSFVYFNIMSGIRRPAKLELGSDRIYEYGSPESSRLTHKLGVIDSNLIKQNDKTSLI